MYVCMYVNFRQGITEHCCAVMKNEVPDQIRLHKSQEHSNELTS